MPPRTHHQTAARARTSTAIKDASVSNRGLMLLWHSSHYLKSTLCLTVAPAKRAMGHLTSQNEMLKSRAENLWNRGSKENSLQTKYLSDSLRIFQLFQLLPHSAPSKGRNRMPAIFSKLFKVLFSSEAGANKSWIQFSQVFIQIWIYYIL